MVEKNKVSIEEFIKIANVKKETIKKNRNKIPGLTYENGEFDIVKGTRYPKRAPYWAPLCARSL